MEAAISAFLSPLHYFDAYRLSLIPTAPYSARPLTTVAWFVHDNSMTT